MSGKPPDQPPREDVCETSSTAKKKRYFPQTSELWRKSLWIWFALIGLLLVVNAIISQIVYRELAEQRASFGENRKFQMHCMEYLSSLKDAENAQRGYLLTSDKSTLAPYFAAQKKIGELNSTLVRHFNGSPEQKVILSQVFEKTGGKFQEMAMTIEAFDRSGIVPVDAIVPGKGNKISMNDIQELIRGVIQRQEDLLMQIGARSQQIRNISLWLGIFTSICGIIFLGILYIYTRQTLRQRTALLQAQRISADRISQALEEKERAFNELTQVNKVKDEFLAIVSHELRTPLNAILGWATLLKEGATPEEYAEGLATIERNARSQSLLIEDLLDVSRVVTGKIRLQLGNVDLREIAKAVAESAKPALDAKNISLELRLYDTSPNVNGDRDRIQQVAWNLITNAIKFTPKGGRITLSVEQIASSMALIVQDNGQGISRDFLPQIFNRFTQADSSTTREQGGLGLGLAIVKHIVELHGGRVYARSEGLGLGSTFKIEIPINAIQPAQPISSTPETASSVTEIPGEEKLTDAFGTTLPNLKNVRVFLVDDQPDTLRVLSNVLIRCGAEIHTAGTAESALGNIVTVKPHVLVSDIGLPDMDGHALISNVRRMSSVGMDAVPALALTAFARSQDRINALEAGFNDHLAKPADAIEFARRVARLCGRM